MADVRSGKISGAPMLSLDLPSRSILPVPRIERPSINAFERDFASKSRPVVIRGIVNGWPAYRAWTAERFLAPSGEREATVVRYVDGDEGTPVRMKVRDYVAAVHSAEGVGLGWGGEPLNLSIPELAAELRLPYLVLSSRSETVAFISGPRPAPYRHASNQFHYHPGLHAFAAQLQGRKLFRLYDPTQTRYLYARNPWQSMPTRGGIPIHRYDPATYPLFAKAACHETILEPGDLLFIPAAWWHLVANEEFAVLATTFYPAPLRQWRLFTTPGLGTVIDRLRRWKLWRSRRRYGHQGLVNASFSPSRVISTDAQTSPPHP